MIQLYQNIKQLSVFKLFLEHPHISYYLRESARLLQKRLLHRTAPDPFKGVKRLKQ